MGPHKKDSTATQRKDCDGCNKDFTELKCKQEVNVERLDNVDRKLESHRDKSDAAVEKLNDRFLEQLERNNKQLASTRIEDKADASNKSRISLIAAGLIISLLSLFVKNVSDANTVQSEQILSLIEANAKLAGDLKGLQLFTETEIQDRKDYANTNTENLNVLARDFTAHLTSGDH